MGNCGHSYLEHAYQFIDLYCLAIERMFDEKTAAACRAKCRTKYLEAWKTAASFAAGLNIDQRWYISWSFARVLPSYPFVNMILSPELMHEFATTPVDIDGLNVGYSWLSMSTVLNGELEYGRDLVEALLCPRNSFDVVFVVCTAATAGRYSELPLPVVEAAKQELRLQPVYRQKYQSLIPEELR